MTALPSSYLLPAARIEWVDGERPRSLDYNDFYYGSADPVAEKEHVFLHLNRLEERWRGLSRGTRGHYTIVELGFGLGINFLLACRQWRQTAPEGWRLHYFSVESAPLELPDLERATRSLPAALEARRLLTLYPAPCPGLHRRHFAENICLTLIQFDAATALDQLNFPVDTWFLDGFRADRNPDVWRSELWRKMHALSRPGATFSTYSAAGWVRRGLEAAGFGVTKRKGFGRKKELMTGAVAGQWKPGTTVAPKSAAVIGGGLAGTSCAAALASRGIHASLIEGASALLRGASGMHQLAYYPQLGGVPAWDSLLSLSANQYLVHYLRRLHDERAFAWDNCGFVHLRTRDEESPRFARLRDQFAESNEVARPVIGERLEAIAGLRIEGDGILYRTGGWVDPISLSAAQLMTAGIELRLERSVALIETGEERLRVSDLAGRTVWQGDAVVIASGTGARAFPQLDPVPLHQVRGQTCHLRATRELARLQVVVGGHATLFPPHEGFCNVAGTYDVDDTDPEWRAEDEERLLTRLAAMLGNSGPLRAAGSKVGMRCVSDDRMPVVGGIPDWPRFNAHFGKLRRNARAVVAPFTDQPRLYAATAFGSHGLNQIPLACEHLASLICGEPSPLPVAMAQLIDPTRFALRALRRQES